MATSVSSATAIGFGLCLIKSVKYDNGENKEAFKIGFLISLVLSLSVLRYLSINSFERAHFKQIFLPELEKIINQ